MSADRARNVQNRSRGRFRRLTMIVAQQLSESLALSEWVAVSANVGDGLQQTVSKSPMISLAVIMFQVLTQCAAEHRSADQYQF
jgi:hypothetical protein